MGPFFSSSLLFLWAALAFLLSFPCPSACMQQQEPRPHPSPRHHLLQRRSHHHHRHHHHLQVFQVKERADHRAPAAKWGVSKKWQERQQQQQHKTKERSSSRGRRSFGAREVSAKLPRGFVPPSGSSSCHNDVPDSLDYYCGGSPSAYDDP